MSMSIDKVIEILDSGKAPENEQDFIDFDTAIETAINLLKTHPDSQPNDPLILEQLRKMQGEPVWLQSKEREDLGRWGIINEVDPVLGFISFDDGTLINLTVNENKLAIYRRKPEEGQT